MNTLKSLKSAYIHIPFCKSKCHYCNFISFADKNSFIKDYFNSLQNEISAALKKSPGIKLNTIYIGGGTPSLIDETFYEKLLSSLPYSDSAEISIEVNPGTVSPEYVQALRKIGFNRLSIGIQSFDDDILKSLNRPHTGKDAINTVNNALNAGFNNISIDLIYGLPAQTLSSWENTLYQATKLGIKHISTYGLKIEDDTEFGRKTPKNLPDEDITSQMYLKTIEILENNGLDHYEISNFAAKGFESKHNLVYWKNEEYFGFGIAAHGYVDRTRSANTTDFYDYINNSLEKSESKNLTTDEILEEAIFLGLRLRTGVNLSEFKRIYSVDLQEKYGAVIKKYVEQGFMTINENQLKLTTQGILLSNNILADFLIS